MIELGLSALSDGLLFWVGEKTDIGGTPTNRARPVAAPGWPYRREFEYMSNGTIDLLDGSQRQ